MAGTKLIYQTDPTISTGLCCAWTVPDNVYKVTFEIWGGGGGGGTPGSSCTCSDSGGPGTGGGYAKKTIDVTPGTVYTVCAASGGVSASGYGSVCARCCNGCAGGTSFVTGTNLVNFCATGGQGGRSDFNTVCYSWCGCQFSDMTGGTGYNGDMVATGSRGYKGVYGNGSPYNVDIHGGNAAGPGGGAGGRNFGLGYNNVGGGDAATSPSMHGEFPGGGGAGSGCYSWCQCTALNSGRGAHGLVKITY